MNGLDRSSLANQDEKGILASLAAGKKKEDGKRCLSMIPNRGTLFTKQRTILFSISVNGLIRQEVDNGIPSDRIVVGGFSQGCVLSLLTGLTSEYKFGGVIGCSGWLALAEKFPSVTIIQKKKIEDMRIPTCDKT